jgi:hypothetical protein
MIAGTLFTKRGFQQKGHPMRVALITSAAALLIATGAVAQAPPQSGASQISPGTSSTSQGAGPGTMQNQKQPTIRSQIQQNLQSAGFTDIRIMPSSFLVRAKDRDGNPVMMVINPDSFEAVTEVGRPGTQQQGSQQPGGTTGSAASTPSTSPSATPGTSAGTAPR